MFVLLQVNKPTLPLASGEYTPVTGVAIVSVFVAMVTMLSVWKKLVLCLMFYFDFTFLDIFDTDMPKIVAQSKWYAL
jgi:hypothetical protein